MDYILLSIIVTSVLAAALCAVEIVHQRRGVAIHPPMQRDQAEPVSYFDEGHGEADTDQSQYKRHAVTR